MSESEAGAPADVPLVVNLADARAVGNPRRSLALLPEGEPGIWPDTGINVRIMKPGQPNCRYHSEPVQEDFLVLHGECLVIMDGEERPLRQWDFVHCPAGTEHVFVGAGDGPCAILMIGSRRLDEPHYPVNELAARYDASVREPTHDPAQAYADWAHEPRQDMENPWPLDRPT
ncbi:MAG: cupin domain-containing protein [Solirubrobacteraceae bacterium]